ncbi:MAG: Ppx/GppA family phosphatase [Clostridia bacterium]|nr:Ppx/GppA family phosphatase [Clostridia bacterium]
MDKKIGIIDLGSNSVRLVIFEIRSNGSFKLVDDISDTVRLSENMINGNCLNDFAMRKAIKTIKLFKKLCSDSNIPPKSIIPVATAAVRKAENRDYFLKHLKASTGLSFRLLSGDEEALYVYNAVIHTLDLTEGIIVDIGGGSTEIIKFKDKSIINYTSIPIGAVVATEEFLEKDSIPPEKLEALEGFIKGELLKLDWLAGESSKLVIGLGGTVRNLAKIHRRMVNYPLEMTHNYQMPITDLIAIYSNLKTLDLEARKKVRGISAKRADIIVGGLAILKVLACFAGAERMIVSGNGLREGVLFEYLAQGKRPRKFTDVLNYSLDNYMDYYGINRDHAEHVCGIALSLFDQLKPLHKLGNEERKLLRVAALLHDIGISVDYYNHHNHSFYIILNSRLNGLTQREILLTAAIAASHSKDKYKDDWEKRYRDMLEPNDIKMYKKLAMLLRIAECLDRSETGIVKSVECQLASGIARIKTFCRNDAELEISLANENSEAFKKLFNKSLVVT